MNAISDAQKHYRAMRMDQTTCKFCNKAFMSRKAKSQHVKEVHRPAKPVKKEA